MLGGLVTICEFDSVKSYRFWIMAHAMGMLLMILERDDLRLLNHYIYNDKRSGLSESFVESFINLIEIIISYSS